MNQDVHAKALKAAAKVAFSIALVGCASAEPDAATQSAAVVDGDGEANPCDATLAEAFPEPGGYQWEPVAQTAEVVACCKAELGEHDFMSSYRWDCCVAFDPKTGESAFSGGACTPWGPPVPPSFGKRAIA